MRDKKDKILFICQVKADRMEVIKCALHGPSKREFLALEAEEIGLNTDDKILSERLSYILKKLSYSDNPVIVSLPRNSVTCRYLKVPAVADGEIQRIASLQTSRYLPYPANELITGYQIINTDKDGYSDINLIIVHKNAITRLLAIFNEVKAIKLTVALSSYGIYNLFKFIRPGDMSPVMLIDSNNAHAELVIIWRDKLAFSRYFKVNKSIPGWENLFIEELEKTRDAYSKEIPESENVRKIVMLATNESVYTLEQAVKDKIGLPVEVLFYHEKIKLSADALSKVLDSGNSFASLFGLGLGSIPVSLNLLPQDIKEKNSLVLQRKKTVQLGLFILGIIFIWFIGALKNLDNKASYLNILKKELGEVAKEAGPLEQIEKKFKLLESHTLKKPSSIDILYELHKIMPGEVSLVNFTYEEANHVILRGQSPELYPINTLVNKLNNSEVFEKFNITLRYTTQKKTQIGEVWNFEIACLKK